MIKSGLEQVKRTSDIDGKIVTAFERISQTLRISAWRTGKHLLLNPVQTQMLLFLLRHDTHVNRISTLAVEFATSKASISETVSSLEKKRLIFKAYHEGNSRNFVVKLTDAGKEAAIQATLYSVALLDAVTKLTPDLKEKLFLVLADIIFDLHKGGVIPVQRICLTCRYYTQIAGNRYCELLERPLTNEEIQIDCSDHLALPSVGK